MYDKRELWKEIERLQEELHDTITQKGINSPEAIRVSHDFRNKMQEYNCLINR
ncbi:MAG: aspartyl-phosphate phosphatase Spo0E family protein [Veillonellales bacterium]